MTVREFADQICERAKEVDNDLTGKGLQKSSTDPEEACMVWCQKRNGDHKNRGWTFPDGTVCKTRRNRYGRQSYCINGRCEVILTLHRCISHQLQIQFQHWCSVQLDLHSDSNLFSPVPCLLNISQENA